tara:strand:+ start:1104 stop:3374 length:2271 start_codon:yes stop_codon:yes gene_type:complete
MNRVKTSLSRRKFLSVSGLAGGGMLLNFSLTAACFADSADNTSVPADWKRLNAYLTIASNGQVTIRSPNPEFGQNVMTSMPMIVAEELDMDWQLVNVEQAPFDKSIYNNQFTGGSRGIATHWPGLRMAGATARHMLRQAAAQYWGVPLAEVTTDAGRLLHQASKRSVSYGELAELAATLRPPKEVELKAISDFRIVGHSRKNVEGPKIVTGKPLFGLDYKQEGMLIAMIVHPPAFGMTLKSVSAEQIKKSKQMPGIVNVFSIKTYADDYERNVFDTNAFPELVAIVGKTTWQVMQAKKSLQVEWEAIADHTIVQDMFGRRIEKRVSAGLESSADHNQAMSDFAQKPAERLRRDGDPEQAFKSAAQVIERTYSAPFLAHNMMEPINFFADVRGDKVRVAGPLQAPEFIEKSLAARLGVPLDNIEIHMTRMGGGFGRRAYSHHLVEAALISQQAGAPVKLIYTREDDITFGVYRPAYQATFRAALDKENRLIGYHVRAGGITESPLERGSENRFPAGAVDHYLAESWMVESNITTGAFRAPRSNFMGAVEQAFLDEVAEVAGKDPIEFRLQLLARAKREPVGERNDYDADRYAGVLQLVKEKSGWSASSPSGQGRGVAAYFCHNSYAAQVVELTIDNGKPVIKRVVSALDCGVVVNPDAASNMVEGAVVDAIGNAFFGAMTFTDGVPDKSNFHNYRMIRHSEAPEKIEVHFVNSDIKPTGLGEPPYPPVFGALANALYQATGKRFYQQPFMGDDRTLS